MRVGDIAEKLIPAPCTGLLGGDFLSEDSLCSTVLAAGWERQRDVWNEGGASSDPMERGLGSELQLGVPQMVLRAKGGGLGGEGVRVIRENVWTALYRLQSALGYSSSFHASLVSKH